MAEENKGSVGANGNKVWMWLLTALLGTTMFFLGRSLEGTDIAVLEERVTRIEQEINRRLTAIESKLDNALARD